MAIQTDKGKKYSVSAQLTVPAFFAEVGKNCRIENLANARDLTHVESSYYLPLALKPYSHTALTSKCSSVLAEDSNNKPVKAHMQDQCAQIIQPFVKFTFQKGHN